MRLSKMTPRNWFKTLMSIAALWVVAGHWVTPYVFARDGSHVSDADRSLPQRFQGVLASTTWTLLTVVAAPPTWIQGRIASLAPRPAGDRLTREELEEQIRTLNNANAWLISQLAAAKVRLREIDISDPLREDMLVSANITALSVGASVDSMTIDRGSNQGLVRGMPVIKNMTLVGYVETVGPVVSTVVLTTDSTMKIHAKIVQTREGVRPITECLVRGSGNGTMTCDTISAVGGQAFAPSKGDLIELFDERWPAGVQNMVIGEVVEVRAEALKYNLTIAPRVRMTTPMHVLVLLQK